MTMPNITLSDGSSKAFAQPVSAAEVAVSISAGLAKAALAAQVNDKLVDLSHQISNDATVRIITAKDPEGLDVIRHSCAHLLAQAVKAIFPQAQVTIGPVIEDGFYYDFAFARPFTPEDLETITAKMQDLAKQDLPVSRHVATREELIRKFTEIGEHYKVEIIKEIPAGEELSYYQQGDFYDLCRGPHVPSTGKIKAFKLMKVSGAFWRGDAKNEMLQRIYGTAWADKKDLDAYLFRLEEAEKRDHRKLAKKYDLFHFQDEAPGMVFWHPKGWAIYQVIEQYMRNKLIERGYQEIKTPQLVDRRLWEKSGHWDKFRQNMFTLTSDDYHHAIKPMNCPCHIQVFNQTLRSHNELPLRLAEFGSCHRYEPSGALHGLLRLRNFVQDDAHIFCTEDQIQPEVADFIKLLYEVYHDFGFTDILVNLSTRPDNRVGSDEIWDKAEAALEHAIKLSNLEYKVSPGEGAFYGPKIDFSLRDCLGRVWQCGTIQVDFSMPGRLEAEYVAEDNSRRVPVMLHRAVFGSIERFIGIVLEETAGTLPLWLAPKQVAVLTITSSQDVWAKNIAATLTNKGFRVLEDLRNEKIGFKIREHTIQRVPYMLIVGAKEMESQTVAVRALDGKEQAGVALADFIVGLTEQQNLRSRAIIN